VVDADRLIQKLNDQFTHPSGAALATGTPVEAESHRQRVAPVPEPVADTPAPQPARRDAD
jgi:hypothetical protein